MRSFVRVIRVLSAVTLFFFCWTFLPLYAAVAYAAEKPRVKNADFGARNENQKTLTTGERLEKALEAIRENVGRAGDKAAKGEDTTAEVESVKARKTEIDAIDIDLKKEFADTEKKLKAANLPKEILGRHNKFVKHYEDNLDELKANIDAIEKAKTPSALATEIAKIKKHFDKVKPPKKRKPFDPNKLPNRIVKAKERQPKLKSDEWEQELKKDKKKTKAASRQGQKPILVASTGPLTGLLSDTAAIAVPYQSDRNLQLANQTVDSILQNAAVSVYSGPYRAQPTPEDMIETPETHITDAIRAKAVEFKNKPVPMFNWLWNNMYFVPSYGSIQGADMCLQTLQCNATDIASLSIALFRAAGFPARYEFATKELPIDRFMETMGGFSDPMAAITFVASGGIPVRPVISGGKITAVQFEHVYASAWIPYGNYRGLMVDNSIPTWVPLDFSLKHYVETPGMDLNTVVPFDAQSFVNQLQSTATINEAEGYVTNVNSALIQQTMQDYQTRVQDYITQNTPTVTVGDVIGKRVIKQEKFPFLPITTWAKDVTNPAGAQSHTLPDNMKYKMSLILQDADTSEDSIAFTVSIAEVAGKRLTLSYVPATATDEQIINNYGGIFNVPAYLVNVKPQIKIEGVVAATGNAIGLGKDQVFNMQFVSVAYGTESVSNIVTAGAYYAIGINPSRISGDLLAQRKAKLEAVKDTICVNNAGSDDCGGELLYSTAMGYFFILNGLEDTAAQSNDVIKMKDVSEAIVSSQVAVAKLFDMPRSVTDAGMMIDVDRNIYVAHSKSGDSSKVRLFMTSAGQMSSVMEHGIFELMYRVKGVSTIQVLQIANSQGVPIYTVTQNNISTVLPTLQVSSEVKADIQNAVGAGKTVVIPQQNISYYTWTGTGYIVQDPATGAGAYMISTSLAGGGCCIAAGGVSVILLALIGSTGAGGSHQCTIFDIEHNVVVDALRVMITALAPLSFGALLVNVGLTNSLMGIALGLTLGAQVALVGFGLILIAIAIYHAYVLYKEFINTASAQANSRIFARGSHGSKYDGLV